MAEALPRADTFRVRVLGLVAVAGLVAFHVVNNWIFVTTQVTILGWDRPAHLVRTLVYNDILQEVNLRSIFEVLTWSWNRPPLSHLIAVPLYRLFGVSTDVALMRNAIFVAMLVFSVYGLARRFYGVRVGLLAAFLVSTCPILFSISRMPYVEYSLTALVAFSIYLLVASQGFRLRGYSLLLGLVVGLGILTKWPFIAFAGGSIAYVALRSGALKDIRNALVTRSEASSTLRRVWVSPIFHASAGLVLALLWYWPNRDRLEGFALGYWLIPLSWLLVSCTLFALSRPPGQGANLSSAALLAATVGSIWSLPNVRFSERFLTVVYSGLNMEGTGLGPLNPSFYFRYLRYLPHEQLSPLYAVVLLLAVGVLLYSRWRRLGAKLLFRGVSESTWILMLWFVVSLLVFTFSLTMNPRFDVGMLPSLAVICARGLCEIKPLLVRRIVVSLVVLLGLVQFLALSYDDLGWLRERALVRTPWGGQVNLLAEGSYVELPSSDRTDSRYFVGPPVLDFIEQDIATRGPETVQLANLVNRSYSNNAIFQYLMYDAYEGIQLREFAREGWEEPPFYERIFECDYLLTKSDPYPGLRQHGEEAARIIETAPSFFEETFEVVWEHTLPDGDTVYLHRRRYHLEGSYDPKVFRAAASNIDSLAQEGDGILLVPGDLVEVLGRYYQGHIPPSLLPAEAIVDEVTLEDRLSQVIASRSRVFLVLWNGEQLDPHGLVEEWLDEHGQVVWDSGDGELRVVVYDVSGSTGRATGATSSP